MTPKEVIAHVDMLSNAPVTDESDDKSNIPCDHADCRHKSDVVAQAFTATFKESPHLLTNVTKQQLSDLAKFVEKRNQERLYMLSQYPSAKLPLFDHTCESIRIFMRDRSID